MKNIDDEQLNIVDVNNEDVNVEEQNPPSLEEAAVVDADLTGAAEEQPSENQEVADDEKHEDTSAAKKKAWPKLDLGEEKFEERTVDEPKRKNSWLSNLFFVAVIALTMFLMYQLSRKATGGDEKTLTQIFQNINWNYFCLALITILLMMLFDSLKYLVIIHATVGKMSFGMALKTSIIGKYYDNITPFSSGGQPFQIHYLHKKGMTGGESTAVVFIKYCFNMLMWLTICFCLMVFNRSALFNYVLDDAQRNLFQILGWVGFGVNCMFPLAIIGFAVFPKAMETITRWILTIGHKLKIVKSKDAVVVRAKRVAKDFRAVFAIMVHKPLHAILLFFFCLAEPFLGMMLPYFIVVAFAGNAIVPSWELMFAIMTLNVYVSMSATIVPTPGNSGAIESAFMLILTTVAEGVLFWTVFTWRFMSYYSYVIIGMIIVIVDFIRNKRKSRQ